MLIHNLKFFTIILVCLLVQNCSVTKSGKSASPFESKDGELNQDQILFSEVLEFLNPGLDYMKDSMWFEAQDSFDSALAKLTEMESLDSLDSSYYNHIVVYRDSLYRLLIQVTSVTSQMAIQLPWSLWWDTEMEGVSDSEIVAMDSLAAHLHPDNYDLPLKLPLHSKVLQAMAVLTSEKGRKYFQKWLNRRSRYESMIFSKLKENNMPLDLIYLAMIESGFSPRAWSRASASGVWQFISATGKRYGLNSDWWVDERRDPEKATEAAIRYLSELYKEFGDWYLAMAAYNCGENRIRRKLKETPGASYWDMSLPRETEKYVPKILAAMIIGKNPEHYGFYVEPESPIAYDTATVFHCLSMANIAEAAETEEEEIKLLNPELKRWCTPPNAKSHLVKIPEGKREIFLANYEKMDKNNLVKWHRHRVSRGENLGYLANRYGVSLEAIKSTNNLKGNLIRINQQLIIPVPGGGSSNTKSPEPRVAVTPPQQNEKSSSTVPGEYVVQNGDNLYDISRKMGISVRDLMQINGLSKNAIIRPGQVLKTSSNTRPKEVSEPDEVASTAKPTAPDETLARDAEADYSLYRVRAGDNLGAIAVKLGVQISQLKTWNNLRDNRINIGQELRYLILNDDGSSKMFYTVKPMDNLWDISVRFQTSVKELKRLNPEMPKVLKPGLKIRVQ